MSPPRTHTKSNENQCVVINSFIDQLDDLSHSIIADMTFNIMMINRSLESIINNTSHSAGHMVFEPYSISPFFHHLVVSTNTRIRRFVAFINDSTILSLVSSERWSTMTTTTTRFVDSNRRIHYRAKWMPGNQSISINKLVLFWEMHCQCSVTD